MVDLPGYRILRRRRRRRNARSREKRIASPETRGPVIRNPPNRASFIEVVTKA